jgi:hypothetical protein
VWTQQELYDRISGILPTVFTLHLLRDVPNPFDQTDVLAECSWAGYSPQPITVTNVQSYPDIGASWAYGQATFLVGQGQGRQTYLGMAVTFISTDGKIGYITVRKYPEPQILQEGESSLTVGFGVQRYDGP